MLLGVSASWMSTMRGAGTGRRPRPRQNHPGPPPLELQLQRLRAECGDSSAGRVVCALCRAFSLPQAGRHYAVAMIINTPF